jgi:hypothetical protein
MSGHGGALELSVAVGDYDRTRPLVDGQVSIDGVAPVFALEGDVLPGDTADLTCASCRSADG